MALCTRRKADDFIAAGKVLINGRVAVLGDKVERGDVVTLARGLSKKMSAGRKYVLYYKPVGMATEDVKMPVQATPALFAIGRLDKESEGLLLLTNDGRVTERLLHPDYDHEKEYEVLVDKRVPPTDLRRLAKGVEIEGYKTKPAEVSEISEKAFRMVLTEGKKHQIRRMCAAMGYQVKKLKRVRIGNLSIGDLKVGEHHLLSEEEVGEFLEAMGLN